MVDHSTWLGSQCHNTTNNFLLAPHPLAFTPVAPSQVHSLVSTKGKVNPSYASGILDAGKKIISREGYPAFWKGNGTSCLHRFPYSAINFYVYEKAFTTLGSISDSNDLEDASYWSAGRR